MDRVNIKTCFLSREDIKIIYDVPRKSVLGYLSFYK